MRTLRTYSSLAAAQLGRSVLDAAGIEETLIPDEFLAGLDWRFGIALQGIRLQVEPALVEDAELVLAEAAEGAPAEATDDAEPAGAECPACGSELIRPAKWKQRLKALSMLSLAVLLLWPLLAITRKRYECGSCRHRWG